VGPDHPATFGSRSFLALILHDLGRLEEAETEARAALEASVRVMGPGHPMTQNYRSNLAIVLDEPEGPENEEPQLSGSHELAKWRYHS